MARRGKNNRSRESKSNYASAKVSVVDTTKTSTQAQSEDVESKEGKNDVAWYARDPQLCVDAARIPFSLPFGADIPEGEFFRMTAGGGVWDTCSQIKTVSNYSEESIPGICSVAVKPSFGTNTKKTDPVNVCANAFYTHVRYMNSGRKNYDPADLFMYAATFGDLISFIVWAKRLYQYAFMYSQRNYYIGKALIEANGFDAQSLVTNLANFRYLINTWINKVSSFCLPGDIYYFSRRAFMFGNFYIENNYGNLKDQLYQFIPDGFYKFVLDDNGAGKLTYTLCGQFGSRDVTWLSNFFDGLFENITGDEDFGIMSGDILKAYGDNRIFLSSLGEEATILPVYDPYVLSQFKNAVAGQFCTNAEGSPTYHVPGHGDTPVFYGELVQFPGDGNLYSREAVIWNDHFTQYGDLELIGECQGAAVQPNLPPIISSENPNPEVGDVIEASRLIWASMDDVRPYSVGTGENKMWIQEVACGTEVVTDIYYATLNHDEARRELLSFRRIRSTCIGSTYFAQIASGGTGARTLNICGQFKYGPMIRLAQFNTDGGSAPYELKSITIMSNTENLAVCSNENIKRLHEVALLSLFFVPGVAKIM